MRKAGPRSCSKRWPAHCRSWHRECRPTPTSLQTTAPVSSAIHHNVTRRPWRAWKILQPICEWARRPVRGRLVKSEPGTIARHATCTSTGNCWSNRRMADSILLIGAGGFVGQRLLQDLLGRGERVIAVSRSDFAAPEGNVETHVRTLREVDDFAPLLARARAVVHVASASTPGSSAGKPVQELDENLRPTTALLQALQACPRLPLIYVSSGGTLYSRVAAGASDELAAVYSRSYHGAGKIAAEHFIEAWCNQFDGTAVVLRPSNLYGPGQEERPGFGIVPTAFGKLVRGETLHVWGDGSAERDYLYIDDFTRLVLATLDAAL